MAVMGHAASEAHMNGDCWAPTCPACQAEDEMEADEHE